MEEQKEVLEDGFLRAIGFNPIVIFSIFYILGIVSFFVDKVFLFSLLLFLLLIFSLLKNFFSYKLIVIYYLSFLLAIVNCNLQIKNFDDLSAFVPDNATIVGVVETIPTTNHPDKTKFYLKVKSAKLSSSEIKNIKARTIVTIYGLQEDLAKIKISDELELKGKLRKPIKATNPSQFDYANYLKNHKTFSTFYVENGGWKIVKTEKTFLQNFLQKLSDKRSDILAIHSKYLKSPNLEILGGIVFGDDAINPPIDIKNSFINSGLLHILAASGMNVSIIFGLWFFIGVRLRLHYRAVIVVGAILVAFYTLMTGMGPSVLRAALMIEFVLLGKLIDRDANSIALVFFVAFLMLLYNPAMINDVGFQLSFVVTFALMFYCPPLLEKIKNKARNFLCGALLIPFIAQLFAAPIQMYYFNTFALYSVFANFLITPFIVVISFLGFVCSILAMMPWEVIANKICMFFDLLLNPFISILVKISDCFSNLPNSLLTITLPTFIQLILYYSILLLVGIVLKVFFEKKIILKKVISFIFILFIFWGFSFLRFEDKNCEIIVFDVGNADSFLIKTPAKKYIMIDTAHGRFDGDILSYSKADSIMVKYFKDFGIKKLDLLILTHFDFDHSGGAIDVMKSVKVDKVLVNTKVDDSKTTKAILDFINKNNINLETAVDNTLIYSDGSFKLTSYLANLGGNSGDNENSIMTLLSFGEFDMLFMADSGIQSFEKIEKYLNLDKLEILKSGHHGAKNTVDDKMLSVLKPDYAVISTGFNTYGHPAKQTLNILTKNNVGVLRTDIDNALKITTDGVGYKVYSFDRKKNKFIKWNN